MQNADEPHNASEAVLDRKEFTPPAALAVARIDSIVVLERCRREFRLPHEIPGLGGRNVQAHGKLIVIQRLIAADSPDKFEDVHCCHRTSGPTLAGCRGQD